MWKLIIIRMAKLTIIEGDEMDCRIAFSQCEYNSYVLFAFLYHPLGTLVDTYIGQHK